MYLRNVFSRYQLLRFTREPLRYRLKSKTKQKYRLKSKSKKLRKHRLKNLLKSKPNESLRKIFPKIKLKRIPRRRRLFKSIKLFYTYFKRLKKRFKRTRIRDHRHNPKTGSTYLFKVRKYLPRSTITYKLFFNRWNLAVKRKAFYTFCLRNPKVKAAYRRLRIWYFHPYILRKRYLKKKDNKQRYFRQYRLNTRSVIVKKRYPIWYANLLPLLIITVLS